jgi:hypothetical protein
MKTTHENSKNSDKSLELQKRSRVMNDGVTVGPH